ncbi:hypothetical protein ACRALDRAFT_207756 [Sodiomyces alcalophilus JCM 7366]|uniref:uncharacterized protein n=1 Tax=Sodiomyces alcalophilus JCM 7366 TaxID=591952 RepID=UPI0039B60CAE
MLTCATQSAQRPVRILNLAHVQIPVLSMECHSPWLITWTIIRENVTDDHYIISSVSLRSAVRWTDEIMYPFEIPASSSLRRPTYDDMTVLPILSPFLMSEHIFPLANRHTSFSSPIEAQTDRRRRLTPSPENQTATCPAQQYKDLSPRDHHPLSMCCSRKPAAAYRSCSGKALPSLQAPRREIHGSSSSSSRNNGFATHPQPPCALFDAIARKIQESRQKRHQLLTSHHHHHYHSSGPSDLNSSQSSPARHQQAIQTPTRQASTTSYTDQPPSYEDAMKE